MFFHDNKPLDTLYTTLTDTDCSYDYNGTATSYNGTFSRSDGTILSFSSTVYRYEIFSYAAGSWTYALGMVPSVGVFGSATNLNGSPYNIGPDHIYHSAQFRSSFALRYNYWESVLDAANIQHLSP
jgi:hypothetical protein